MYAIKRERNGRILNENFDHEVTTLSSFKNEDEAKTEIKSRLRAQAEHYGDNANFTGTETDFTVTVKMQDYNVTEHFYIEKE